MKTREIEVYACPYALESLLKHDNYQIYLRNKPDQLDVKARLIIELPEKKIQITESDFDEALAEIVRVGLISYGSAYYNNIKAKLFKDA